jgi:hypothetical protein
VFCYVYAIWMASLQRLELQWQCSWMPECHLRPYERDIASFPAISSTDNAASWIVFFYWHQYTYILRLLYNILAYNIYSEMKAGNKTFPENSSWRREYGGCANIYVWRIIASRKHWGQLIAKEVTAGRFVPRCYLATASIISAFRLRVKLSSL